MPMKTSSVAEQTALAKSPVRAKDRPPNTFAPLWTAVGLVAVAFAARFVLLWQLPFPPCWLRKLTGIPCPSCGCTRSLAAWTYLDLERALRFNPLFFLLCAGVVAWLAAWLAEIILQRTFLASPRARLKQWPWWRIGAVLLVLNWLYLCLMLPK